MNHQTIILTLDGRPPAILDKDLAARFQVKTKEINKSRTRNPKRFPKDFAFQLTDEECKRVRFQNQHLTNWFTYNPWAYTEEGMLTMSGCMNSDAASEMAVYLARMFRDTRGMLRSQQQLLELMSMELLKSRPLWQAIKRYKALGLSHAEIGKLTERKGNTVRGHVRNMERCGLLVAPRALAQQQQYALNFSGASTASPSVIPASPSVIPASPSVIPAQAGIQGASHV